MRNSLKHCSFVVYVVLAWLVAPSANAAVHYIGRINEPSLAFTAEYAGSGGHATEGLDKLLTDDKLPVTEMPTVPELSTWVMMLLWFIGAGLGVVRGSRKRSVQHFE
jgi:hypothetical protein